MGVFGFTEISITYEENATNKQIEAFITELKQNEELTMNNFDTAEYFEISSGRLANLRYQEGIVMSIVEKHKDCINQVMGSCFAESDSDIYYDKHDEEVQEEKDKKRMSD